jgi:hypothetical protein
VKGARWLARRMPVKPYGIEGALSMARCDWNWPGLVAELADLLDDVAGELAERTGTPFTPVEVEERLLTSATLADVDELETVARQLAARLDAARLALHRLDHPGAGRRRPVPWQRGRP